MTSQQKTKSSVLWAGAVFVLAFLFQLIGMSRQINGYDECIELFGAVRVLHGDVIYRDFWALYGPAQFYVIATLFKLFGISVLVGRLYHVFAGACVIALLFALTARLTSRLTALLAALWAMIWMTGVIDLSYEFPTYPALALILAGIWFLLPLLRNETNPRATVVSGICVGLVTLFRHDFGFYAFVCLILMIAGRGITSHKEGTHFRRIAARNTRESAVFILGLLLILVPSALIIFLHVPFHDVYFALIYVPARIYPKVRSLPFPRPAFLFHSLKMHDWEKVEGAIDYFPGMVCFTSIAYLFASRRTWEEKGDLFGRRLHVLLTLLLVLMTLKGLVRVSPIQLIQAIVLGGAVLAIVLYRMTSRQWYIALLVGCCIVVAALPTRVALKEVLRRSIANGRNAFGRQSDNYPGSPGGLLKNSCSVTMGLERMRCFYLPPFEVQAIQYIQANTNPSDTIYVGAGRHDKLFLNNLAFYFISQRMSGTKWHDLHPGIETTQAIQTEMIADLERSATRYVVLDSTFDNYEENNQERYSSGVTLLDDYIRNHYQQVAVFGPITILQLDSPVGSTSAP